MSLWDCRKLEIHGAPFHPQSLYPQLPHPTNVPDNKEKPKIESKLFLSKVGKAVCIHYVSACFFINVCCVAMCCWSHFITDVLCVSQWAKYKCAISTAIIEQSLSTIYPFNSLHLLFAIRHISPPSPCFTNHKASYTSQSNMHIHTDARAHTDTQNTLF